LIETFIFPVFYDATTTGEFLDVDTFLKCIRLMEAGQSRSATTLQYNADIFKTE